MNTRPTTTHPRKGHARPGCGNNFPHLLCKRVLMGSMHTRLESVDRAIDQNTHLGLAII
jgi:hypothetical protein